MTTCEATCDTATPTATQSARTYKPNMDIVETPTEYVIRGDMPGARADSIDVQFDQGRLHIRAAVDPRCAPSGTPIAQEYGVGDFARSIVLGEDVEAGQIVADYALGVLTIRVPKRESLLPRRIEVKGG
jgi:HSP20 family protein